MIRSPATLTIANFNRQTLADLLRPVLDRAMKQGMVGTNVVLEIVAEALSKIGDSEIRTFLDPKTGKLRGGLEIRIEETLSMSKKWRDWDANHGNEDWMLRKSGRTVKKNEFLKSLILICCNVHCHNTWYIIFLKSFICSYLKSVFLIFS